MRALLLISWTFVSIVAANTEIISLAAIPAENKESGIVLSPGVPIGLTLSSGERTRVHLTSLGKSSWFNTLPSTWTVRVCWSASTPSDITLQAVQKGDTTESIDVQSILTSVPVLRHQTFDGSVELHLLLEPVLLGFIPISTLPTISMVLFALATLWIFSIPTYVEHWVRSNHLQERSMKKIR